MKIILGSQSVGRKRVLQNAGYTFEIMVADIDEKAIRSDNLEELPLILARAKAQALLPKINEPAILITSDQIVVCHGELREKPESKEQAYAYLKSYGKYPAQTNTSVFVTNTQTGKTAEALDIAKVFFKPIPDANIHALITEGKIFSAAGGFITENPLLSPYVDHIEGDPTSVTGLPLNLTRSLIAQATSINM